MIKVYLLLLLTLEGCIAFVCHNTQPLRLKGEECTGHLRSSVVLSSSRSSSNNQHNNEKKDIIEGSQYSLYKRRNALSKIVASPTLLVGAAATIPSVSNAAPPMTIGETENVKAKVERSLLRPKPVKSLRPKLNLDFAVLLMRSSYNALDMIDCVPMDQFQRDFFLIRQAEYQPYVESLGPGFVQQGQLIDPYYFDFISFAQYATISRDVAGDPPAVFEEQQPAEEEETTDENDGKNDEVKPQRFVPKVIRRDPSLLDNSLLPSKHAELVGESILDKLNDTFGNTPSALPVIQPKSRPDVNIITASLKQLLNLFLINGFAWDGNVASTTSGSGGNASGTQFVITFTSPATLWSGQALKVRGANPTNDFYLKTAKILLKNSGYAVANSSVKYVNSQEITTFTIV